MSEPTLDYADDFGSLPLDRSVDWGCGSVRPMPDHTEVWPQIEDLAHVQTRLVYPPQSITTSVDPWTGEETPVEGSERPAPMYFLHPTHHLRLAHPEVKDMGRMMARKGLAGFSVYFLGFLLGFRTQFLDWKIYGPYNVKRERSFLCCPSEAAQCMEAAVTTWEGLGPDSRRRLVNLLFQFQRVPCLDLTWEQFKLSFAVTDVCFRILQDERGLRSPKGHAGRWEAISGELGIPHGTDGGQVTNRLVNLRNELVHELGWDGYLLGHGYPTDSPSPDQLSRCFAERVILGLLDVPAGFVSTHWWGTSAVQMHALGLPRRTVPSGPSGSVP